MRALLWLLVAAVNEQRQKEQPAWRYLLTIRPALCGYNAASRRPERCYGTDWNGRQFDGKNATHLRESCGLSVSMADHHRSGRYADDIPYRWLRGFRRKSEESRGVGTLIPGRAFQRAD